MPLPRAPLALLVLLPLLGCDDPTPAPPPRPPEPRAAEVAPASPAPQSTPGQVALRVLPDFEQLAAQVMPAVVSIAVTQEAAAELPEGLRGTPYERAYRDRFRGQPQQEMTGAGSGFIIDPEGLVVTANHVVGEASRVTVSLLDGTILPAEVLGTDDLTDLAVLRVRPARPLPYVSLGRSGAMRIGQWVLAAGNPFGLGGSVTSGIVSALGRNIGLGPFDDFIQTDAPINPGNSGGPLFNLAGEVIGINTAIYSPSGASAGIGFATPSDLAGPVIARLRVGERVARGWLGVAIAEPRPDERRPARGVAIAEVMPGGPAQRGGVRRGDVVLQVGGEPVAAPRDLLRRIAGIPPGEQVALTLLRDGREQRVTVRVAERPAETGARP